MASFLPASCLNVAAVDGGLDLDVFHGQVAHGLVAVKKRKLAHELAELIGAGALVAQDRQLVLDEWVIDKGHTGRIVGDGHGLKPLSLRPEDGLADKAHGDVVAARRA